MTDVIKNYQLTVGMEVHCELKTATKMFCSCANDPDANEPNTRICPVCMGHPGTLPVPNKKAIESVIKVGLALGCDIAERSKFDRKNYFYPDLPKGYQISQFDEPLCRNGQLITQKNADFTQTNAEKSPRQSASSPQESATVRIYRIHLEEDTGKLLHPTGANYSLVDYNRAGVPLMELVTEPDLHDVKDARKFCEELQLLFRYLGVSDADMEKGHMRCEANISIARTNADSTQTNAEKSPQQSALLGTKVEVKNLNSFKAVERAIAYEFERQTKVLEAGERVVQETRGWDDAKGETYTQRSKEEAHDYRYFPEPDVPPLHIRGLTRTERGPSQTEEDISVEELKTQLPELPWQRRARFTKAYGLSADQVEIFVIDKTMGDYFENVSSELASEHNKGEYAALDTNRREQAEMRIDTKGENKHQFELNKLAANYLINDVPRVVSETGIAFNGQKVSAENFAELILRIEKGVISSAGAKVVLADMLRTGADPDEIIRDKNIAQVSDMGELEKIVAGVIKANASVAQDYKNGKQATLQFLMGQVMKETKGKANPKVAQDLLRKALK